jgi:hypothetical protein
MPKMCNVSMIGNSHNDSRIAVPIEVWLSQWQKLRNTPILQFPQRNPNYVETTIAALGPHYDPVERCE